MAGSIRKASQEVDVVLSGEKVSIVDGDRDVRPGPQAQWFDFYVAVKEF